MHLQDAVFALDVRELVAHLDVVRRGRHVVAHGLLHLVLAAARVRVVAAGVFGVYRAGVVGVVGAGEWVLVEALLGHHAVRVVEVVDVAQEELEVTLRYARGGGVEGRVRSELSRDDQIGIQASAILLQIYLRSAKVVAKQAGQSEGETPGVQNRAQNVRYVDGAPFDEPSLRSSPSDSRPYRR